VAASIRVMPRALGRQLPLFLLAGAAQVLLDWAVFVGLSAAGFPLAPSNLAGRIVGACLGFWLNGRYTFAGDGRSRLTGLQLRRFVAAWLLLSLLSTLLLSAVQSHFDLHAAWIAKPAVEAAMAVLGFIVWRQWVFR
jgi:putative flippase GtrA